MVFPLISLLIALYCVAQATEQATEQAPTVDKNIGPLGLHLEELSADTEGAQKISRLVALDEDRLSFVIKRLMKEKKMTLAQAEEARTNFLRYMSFDFIAPETVVYPSEKADAFWHEFLMFTVQYRHWCHKHFGKFMDHVPFEDEGEGEDIGDAAESQSKEATCGKCGSSCGMHHENIQVDTKEKVGGSCGKCGMNHKKDQEEIKKSTPPTSCGSCSSMCGMNRKTLVEKKDEKEKAPGATCGKCGSSCGKKHADNKAEKEKTPGATCGKCGSSCGKKHADNKAEKEKAPGATCGKCGSSCGKKRADNKAETEKTPGATCGKCGSSCGKGDKGEKALGAACGSGSCGKKCFKHKELAEGSLAPSGSCGKCGTVDLEKGGEPSKEEKLSNWHGTVALVKRIYGDDWSKI